MADECVCAVTDLPEGTKFYIRVSAFSITSAFEPSPEILLTLAGEPLTPFVITRMSFTPMVHAVTWGTHLFFTCHNFFIIRPNIKRNNVFLFIYLFNMLHCA